MSLQSRRRRLGVAMLGALGLSGALAGPAVGSARVSLVGGGSLVVAVDPVSGGPDGNHGMIIEPFEFGFRVKQDVFGRPPFSRASDGCNVNPFFNDVVCQPGRTAITVTGGDGLDVVRLTSFPVCAEDLFVQPPVRGPAVINLGAGSDTVSAELVCDPPLVSGLGRDFIAAVNADGEDGDDTLAGGVEDDVLSAGPDDDTISGGEGNDRLIDGSDQDEVHGDAGRDLITASTGDDLYDGGPGVDTVSYASRNTALTVSVADAGSGDGAAGENDKVQGTVENVIGGKAGDLIEGAANANVLTGFLGDDTLVGKGGADRLEGDAGNDVLDGGDGIDVIIGGLDRDSLSGGTARDSLIGGEGNDLLNARDGERDSISCGPGADRLLADAIDPRPPDCEVVEP